MTATDHPPSTREPGLTALRPLARQFPTLDSALAEIARLSAELTLPKGTVHVLSDLWQPPRRVADTEQGEEIRRAIQLLGHLVEAYRSNWLRQG